jgi:hypothetical protein
MLSDPTFKNLPSLLTTLKRYIKKELLLLLFRKKDILLIPKKLVIKIATRKVARQTNKIP